MKRTHHTSPVSSREQKRRRHDNGPILVVLPTELVFEIIGWLPDSMLVVAQFLSKSVYQHVKFTVWPYRVQHRRVKLRDVHNNLFGFGMITPILQAKKVHKDLAFINRGPHNIMDYALSHNYQPLLDCIYTMGCPFTAKSYARVGNIETFEWLVERNPVMYITSNQLYSIAKRGDLALLKMVIMSFTFKNVDTRSFLREALPMCAFYGYSDIIRWLLSYCQTGSIDADPELESYFRSQAIAIIYGAAIGNRPEVINWCFGGLLSTCGRLDDATEKSILKIAIEMNSMDVIKWMCTGGSTPNIRSVLIDFLNYRGTFDDLQYIEATFGIKCSHECSPNFLYNGIRHAHTPVYSKLFKYLSSPKLDARLLLEAMKSERWTFQSGAELYVVACNYNRIDTLEILAANDVIFKQWIRSPRPLHDIPPTIQCGPTPLTILNRGLKSAATNGFIGPIKWLFSYISPRDWISMMSGHAPLSVELLDAKRASQVMLILGSYVGLSLSDMDWILGIAEQICTDRSEIPRVLFRGAAEGGNVHIIEWYSKKYPSAMVELHRELTEFPAGAKYNRSVEPFFIAQINSIDNPTFVSLGKNFCKRLFENCCRNGELEMAKRVYTLVAGILNLEEREIQRLMLDIMTNERATVLSWFIETFNISPEPYFPLLVALYHGKIPLYGNLNIINICIKAIATSAMVPKPRPLEESEGFLSFLKKFQLDEFRDFGGDFNKFDCGTVSIPAMKRLISPLSKPQAGLILFTILDNIRAHRYHDHIAAWYANKYLFSRRMEHRRDRIRKVSIAFGDTARTARENIGTVIDDDIVYVRTLNPKKYGKRE